MKKSEIAGQLDALHKQLMETHSPEELQKMKIKVDVLESMMRMGGQHDDDTDEEGHHHHEHVSE